MWIVQLALKRPYTFVVMALLIVVLGITSSRQRLGNRIVVTRISPTARK